MILILNKNGGLMEKLTIIVPFLNEEQNLMKFTKRIIEIKNKIKNYNIEYIFVDDGSTDNSLNIVKSIEYENKKILSFSKNYGSHYAIFAAIDVVDTDYLTFMSSDMQEPVELYFEFIQYLHQNSEYDMVFAQRKSRNTNKRNQLFSKTFNLLVKKLAFHDFPENGTDVFMLKRNVIETLKKIEEKNTSIYGVLFTVGYKKGFVPYEQLAREAGVSKWTLSKKIKMFVDTFVSFTLFPLRLITFTGILFSSVGILYGILIIINSIYGFIEVEGWATLVSLVTFGFGLTFLMIGIISEYLWRMFDQIRPRPRYIIKEMIGFSNEKKNN